MLWIRKKSPSTTSRAPSKTCSANSPRAPSTSTTCSYPPGCIPAVPRAPLLDGATVAWFGQLHPAEAERRKLKQTVFIGEIYLDRLYRQKLRQPLVRELSRFQPVRRDFSLLFSNSTTYAAIEDKLRSLDIPELRSFAPKEILRESKSILTGHFSLLLGAVFQSQERTLREEELQQFSQAIVAAMESIGGRLRT